MSRHRYLLQFHTLSPLIKWTYSYFLVSSINFNRGRNSFVQFPSISMYNRVLHIRNTTGWQDKFWSENFKFRFKNGISYDIYDYFAGRIVDEFIVIFLKAIWIASEFRSLQFFPLILVLVRHSTLRFFITSNSRIVSSRVYTGEGSLKK